MRNIKSISSFFKNVVDVVSVVDSCFTLADVFIKPEPAPDYREEYEGIVSLYFGEDEDAEEVTQDIPVEEKEKEDNEETVEEIQSTTEEVTPASETPVEEASESAVSEEREEETPAEEKKEEVPVEEGYDEVSLEEALKLEWEDLCFAASRYLSLNVRNNFNENNIKRTLKKIKSAMKKAGKTETEGMKILKKLIDSFESKLKEVNINAI